MADKEKGPVPSRNTDDPSEEAAAAKLWAVYVSEAEKYDKALVESWKSDMEGMLIFAGLFSASLTAFLIESYKTLNPDSGDMTVKLLTQISLQLVASANGSTLQLPESTPFTPPAASLVCNAFWFISLGFSLTCALIATLLEQWARDFLHKADMRSAPVIRARVYSYFYYGLKRFNMHTVVEIIPLLLHASLLFFFAGLVAFLIPVNVIMTAITGVLLFIVAGVYAVLMFLPLQYFDSPYRTPLSGAFWWLFHSFKRLWKHRHAPGAGIIESQLSDRQSMVKAMFHAATQPSDDRWARDNRALVWTMKSLADDNELEPFVDAIPDVLWGPRDRLHKYREHIQHLTDNPELEVLPRIHGLLHSCTTGFLSPEVIKHRRIACYKALWAIASLCIPARSHGKFNYAVDFSGTSWITFDHNTQIRMGLELDPDIVAYRISAKAMMQWSTFCSVLGSIHTHQEFLVTCAREVQKGRTRDLTSVLSFVRKYQHFHSYAGELYGSPASLILQLKKYLDAFLSEKPYVILWSYLENAVLLTSPPHGWHATQKSIILQPDVISSTLLEIVESYLNRIIPSHLCTWNAVSDKKTLHWVDFTLSRLLASWQPQDNNTTIPHAIIQLLNGRNSDLLSDDVLWSGWEIQKHLWSAFPQTLSRGPSKPRFSKETHSRESLFTALWRLAFLSSGPIQARVKDLDSVLEILVSIDPSFPPLSQSIIALIKSRLVTMSLNTDLPREERQSSFSTSIFPEDTAIPLPNELPSGEWDDGFTAPQIDAWELYQQQKVLEAKISLLAEFLEHCSIDPPPYRVVETLQSITGDLPMVGPVHATYQNRLANSIYTT
ncbi:hypothetical protein FB451DRAFT_1570998 [Mycena latifolia]|nr:hypothetical protein FB451DRAFT_1570998 [Mycena latifolia]